MDNLLVYIKTLQYIKSIVNGGDSEVFVKVSSSKIYEILHKDNGFSVKKQLSNALIDGRVLCRSSDMYKCVDETVKPDITTVRHTYHPVRVTERFMIECLKYITAKTYSSKYFELFSDNLEHYEYFFVRDSFSGRIHTPITSLSSSDRETILIDRNETVMLDVATMQPLILGKILKQNIGNNEFSEWIDSGVDVYTKLQRYTEKQHRTEAKKLFFKLVFGRNTKELNEIFNGADWVQWIKEYKDEYNEDNPSEKKHSNLVWLLQNEEVKLMTRVWDKLRVADIKFLTVHDEIIVEKFNYAKANLILITELSKEFKYFKINKI